MKSQVSFKLEGRHNVDQIKKNFNERFKGSAKVKEESLDRYGILFRIYVSVPGLSQMETYNICKGIQSGAVLDSTKEL